MAIPGQATFVIITRNQTGSYKVVERFPLTAEGWAAVTIEPIQTTPASTPAE